MKGIQPREQWLPELRTFPELKGIFVGGCVTRGVGSSFRASAHAHASPADPNHGWICVRAEWKAKQPLLMLHELAHILTGNGHTKEWRQMLLAIGGTLDPVPGLMKSYHPRKRFDKRIVV